MSRGLSVVDPVRATSSAAPLAAHIEALSADGMSYGLPAPPPIPPGPRRVTFTYSGVSLSAPDEIRFRYRLDGFDPGWSEPVSAREAVYTNLGPGDVPVPRDGLQQRGALERRGSGGRRRDRAPRLADGVVPFHERARRRPRARSASIGCGSTG